MHNPAGMRFRWACIIVLVLSLNEGKELMVKGTNRNTLELQKAVFSFNDLVTNGMFVDKSLLIPEFLNSKCFVNVITRPPKWGKSVNIEMVERFFEIEVNELGIHRKISERKNHILFEGGEYTLLDNSKRLVRTLKVAAYSETTIHLGAYPVVLLRLSSVKGGSYADIEKKLTEEFRNIYIRHSYLKVYLSKENLMLNSSDKTALKKYFSNKELTISELECGLSHLSKLLYEHFRRKTIILIDDMDSPLNNAVESFGDRGPETFKVLNLLKHILKGITNNAYMHKCMITGTVPFIKDAIFLNSSQVCVSSVLDGEYSKYFGFSEPEVDEVVKQRLPNVKSTEKMKTCYKGWYYGGDMLYNPYDIMSFIENKGHILDYWAESSKVKSFDKFLIRDEAQQDILKLLEDEGIVKSLAKPDKPDQEDGHDLFLQLFYVLMVHNGYLNAFNLTDGGNEYLLRIPNQEVRNFLVDFKTQWFCNKFDVLDNDLNEFAHSFVTGKSDLLSESLKRIFRFSNFKNVKLEKEKDYHNYMSEIFHRFLNQNFVFSGKHFELGRLYHMIVPRSEFQGNSGFVIEYRLLTDSNTKTDLTTQLQSLAQLTLDHIDCNLYGPLLIKYRHVEKVSIVAVAFHKTELEVAYKEFSQEGTLC